MTRKTNEIHVEGRLCLSARHVIALLGFLGFMTVYALRANLSVAMVAMVKSNPSAIAGRKSGCLIPLAEVMHPNNTLNYNTSSEIIIKVKSSISKGEFNWDAMTQGYILAGFFYGYIFTQLPGGWLATYSPKYTLGLGILWTSVLTLLTPFAARLNPWALMGLRVLMGFGEGVTFPAMHSLWSRWAPPNERSALIAFTYAGAPMGNVVAYPLSGFLSERGFAGGWPSIFYVMGAMGCVWYVFWQFFVFDRPSLHPRISDAELAYLEKVVHCEKSRPNVPWKSIFTSLRFWAIVVAHFGYNWGFYSMITLLPKFFKDVLGLDIEANGLYSALPFLMQWAFIEVSGYLADFLLTHSGLSTTTIRRVFNTCGFIVPACFLIGVGYVNCNVSLAITLLTIGVGFTGLSHVGFFVSHLDIAPQFAGILMSLTNTVATIPGIVAPSVATAITQGHSDAEHWRYVFAIAAIVYTVCAIFYCIFVSGEEQPWSILAQAPSSPTTSDKDLTYSKMPETKPV